MSDAKLEVLDFESEGKIVTHGYTQRRDSCGRSTCCDSRLRDRHRKVPTSRRGGYSDGTWNHYGPGRSMPPPSKAQPVRTCNPSSHREAPPVMLPLRHHRNDVARLPLSQGDHEPEPNHPHTSSPAKVPTRRDVQKLTALCPHCD